MDHGVDIYTHTNTSKRSLWNPFDLHIVYVDHAVYASRISKAYCNRYGRGKRGWTFTLKKVYYLNDIRVGYCVGL